MLASHISNATSKVFIDLGNIFYSGWLLYVF